MNRKERRRQAKLNRNQGSIDTFMVTEDTPTKTDAELTEMLFREMATREVQSWDEDRSEHLEQAVFNRLRDFAYTLLQYKADTLTETEQKQLDKRLDDFIELETATKH